MLLGAIRYLVSSPAPGLFGIVFTQQWRLEWCMGVEADKCGILNRVKALLLYPFGGGCPALKR